ncbi:hypothetical protein KDW_33720 [Dictyobacter vulcani]|uniref:3-methyl-2-oxobutanoate hydroxymethyltransferase n=1 Tax=Dictyobacter vulcani TaxID=2607529 RepID=A0A5J4KS17_9CHLR|nr:hypothetical protein KDW_33720 [Dictyobacter vulcani]
MARIVDQAGIDMILVGDSLATTVLGQPDTLAATVETMIYHSAAVAQVQPKALIVTDMPWLSYHISPEETIRNAGRLVREGKAEAVKLEGGRKRLPMIEAILAAEIPVMGHLGLTPQSVHAMGGYKVQGKDLAAARELLEDAKALAQAGVFAVVLEGIPDILAKRISEEIAIPTIGIGAGPHCDGQVLVFHDLLGLTSGHLPNLCVSMHSSPRSRHRHYNNTVPMCRPEHFLPPKKHIIPMLTSHRLYKMREPTHPTGPKPEQKRRYEIILTRETKDKQDPWQLFYMTQMQISN